MQPPPEKKTEVIKVYCTPSQKRRYEALFGFAEIGHLLRDHLDKLCRKKSS